MASEHDPAQDEISARRAVLGRELRQRRQSLQITQKQLARQIGYSRSAVANTETGYQHADRDFWERCDRALAAGGVLTSEHDKITALRQARKDARALAACSERDARIVHDDRPGWAQRLQHVRRARGWSQQQAVDAMREAADEVLAEDDLLVGKWKRWESGTNLPDARARLVIARAFGVDPDTLFAPGTGQHGDAGVTIDPEVIELIARIDRSDVDQAALDRIAVAVDQMCADYSALPASDLLSEATGWFARIDQMLGQRHSETQRREISQMLGWLALLTASVQFDLGHRRLAQLVRRYVDRLADETGNAHHKAWARELDTWLALNEGNYGAAAARALAGQDLAPNAPVAAQLAGHEAEAHARMGDQRAALAALDKLNNYRARMPKPETPRHHFQLEPAKFDKVEMRLQQLFGRHNQAVAIAENILCSVGGPDTGALVHPMVTVKCLTTIAVASTTTGDLDQAVALGHQAIDVPRQSIPSLITSTTDLRDALTPNTSEPAVRELTDRIDRVSHRTAQDPT